MAGEWEAAARSCTYVLFGMTVASVLSDRSWNEANRNLDVFEVWSGAASVQRAALAYRFTAEAFDIKNSNTEDLLSPQGFHKALQKVMRLRPGGLLSMAPVCSSFIGLNTVRTYRKLSNLSGDESYRPVKEGNFMARVAGFFLCLAAARGVHFCIENPASSMMFAYLADVLSQFPFLVRVITHRCCWSPEPFGLRYRKAYKFISSGPWLLPVQNSCNCPPARKGGAEKHLPMVRVDEKGRYSGIPKALVDSQAYPDALGTAIVQAWCQAKNPSLSWNQAPHHFDIAKGQKSRHQTPTDEWGSWEENKDSGATEATGDWSGEWSPQKAATNKKRKSGSSSSSSSSKASPAISTRAWSSSKGKNSSEDFGWPESPEEASSNSWAWDS